MKPDASIWKRMQIQSCDFGNTNARISRNDRNKLNQSTIMPSIHEKSFRDLNNTTRNFNSNQNSPRLELKDFSLPFITKTSNNTP